MSIHVPVSPLRRRNKLVRPGYQLRLVASFLGVALLGTLLQFLATHWGLMRLAADIPGVGGEVADEVPGLMLKVLAFTVAIVVPLLVAVGILLTFRTAGPLYRLETYLENVISGKETGPCRLRDGDELQELCSLINRALEHAQQSSQADELRKSA